MATKRKPAKTNTTLFDKLFIAVLFGLAAVGLFSIIIWLFS